MTTFDLILVWLVLGGTGLFVMLFILAIMVESVAWLLDPMLYGFDRIRLWIKDRKSIHHPS